MKTANKVKTATTCGNITFTATKRFVRIRCKGQPTFKVVIAANKFTSSVGDVMVSSKTAEGCYKKAIRSFWSV
jgi:hypothetical protein